jgi:nitrogen fixation protein NifX
MKIAFTSTDGTVVDQHFGTSDTFWLWEVDSERAECVGQRSAIPQGLDQEDRIVARATALEGCSLVYTMQIGGPAAAKLVARHIHPMKTTTETPIEEVVEKLQTVLRGNPPPWLRKALGQAPQFQRYASEDDD